jgi:hypothetical protein
MCVSIEFEDGTVAESMAELCKKVGTDNVVNQDHSTPEENDEWCLCGVDIEATAEKSGYIASRAEYGFDYTFVPVKQH